MKTKNCTLRLLTVIVLAAGLMLVAEPVAYAATFTVTSTADDGSPGTLRWAINEINVSGTDDVIDFNLGSGPQTITLENALPAIKSHVSIVGPGAAQVIIERSRAGGTPQFRLLTIAQSKTVTISGLTLTNGYIEDDGITDPEVDDYPYSRWYNGSGGAILAHKGVTLTIKACIITDNQAVDEGGGIFVNSTEEEPSTLTITESTISHDVAGGGNGGGIYFDGYGTITIDECKIVNNQAADEGGGAFTYYESSITVTNSDISNNVAAGGEGGGMHIRYFFDAVFRNSTFHGNEAGPSRYAEGGGLNAYWGENVLEITDCVFSHNKASGSQGNGGGIYLSNHGLTTISRCTVSNNTAGTVDGWYGHGGGIYQRSAMVLNDTTISGNTAIGTTGNPGKGGGIYNDEAELTATNCTISDNTADNVDDAPGLGGGMFMCWEAAATLIHSTITGNSADGGAVYIEEGSVSLSDTIVANQQIGGADCAGPGFSSNGFNIDSDGSCNLSQASDQPNTDPLLGALTDNGGPTLTHALLSGSPAIDAGECNGGTVTADQRGVSRPQGPACDIGAFEYSSAGDITIEKSQTADETVLAGETFFYELAIQNSYDGLVDMLVTDILSEHLDYVDNTLEIRKDGTLLGGVDDDLVMAGDSLSYRTEMSGIDLLTIAFEVKVSDLVDIGTLIINQAFVTVFSPGTNIVIDGAESNIVQAEVVPEPATVTLIGIGLAGVLALTRRTRKGRR